MSEIKLYLSSFNFDNVAKNAKFALEHAYDMLTEQIINPFYKYTYGLLTIFLHRVWSGDSVANKDVILVLTAKHDHNGAFYIPTPVIWLKCHLQNSVKVIYKSVSSIEDANNQITDLKLRHNRIRTLWFRAHGSPTSFVFGKQEKPSTKGSLDSGHSDTSNIYTLLPAFKALEKNSSIILDSCRTGHVSEYEESIAQKIADLAPHSHIFAPLHNSTASGFDVQWNKKRLDATFTIAKESNSRGYREKLLNIFYSVVFHLSFGYLLSQNDTGIFKHVRKVKRNTRKNSISQAEQTFIAAYPKTQSGVIPPVRSQIHCQKVPRGK